MLARWSNRDLGSDYSLRWISEKDRGHADALNKGFDRARGQIVGWLNSDDVYFGRDAVSHAVQALAKRPDVDVVFGDVALIDENSGLWMIWCFPRFDYRRALRGYILPQPTVFFRRIVTDTNRLDPDLKVATDYVYWLLIGRKHKFLHLHRVQAGDRDHGARQTHVNRELWERIYHASSSEFGGSYRPGRLARRYDTFVRLMMRGKGLLHALNLLGRRGRDPLAFPMWIDQPHGLLRRQMLMRITKRPALGAPPDQVRRRWQNTIDGALHRVPPSTP